MTAYPIISNLFYCRFGRIDFTWLVTGSIQVVAHVHALPFVSLRIGSSSNKMALVACVMLVALTAVQVAIVAYSVWARITEATSWWRSLQV